MSEDQGVQGDLERIDEDELYIRDYIYTFGIRYVDNFWAIKFAAPIDLSNGETAAGIGFRRRGMVFGIGGVGKHNGPGRREFDFWTLSDEDKQALADQLPSGNCGLFAFERHESSGIEEESMFHRSPETIRKYIRDNGHMPKDQLWPACRFKEPVRIHLGYKETATAIGMSCPNETNGGPWVLLNCDSSKCGAPEIELSKLVNSDKFKCCDQLRLGDAGEFDWENVGPQTDEQDEGRRSRKNIDVMEHKFPVTPSEIVAEGKRLMSALLTPACDNYEEIKWMTQNGWLEIDLKMSKTEKFLELEKMISNEKEKLEEEK